LFCLETDELREIAMPYTEFTLWLTPSEPLRASLRSTISQLGARLDAIEFEPHVTVFCGPSTPDQASAVARRIASRFPPIELTADHIEHSGVYTKTLFVQFHESALLRVMFETAKTHHSLPSNYVLNPHLSLIYKELPEARRKELAETLDVPTGRYEFDRLRVIETELPIENEGPIRRWRILCDDPLVGA
jgi:2'-5' RNA ligase